MEERSVFIKQFLDSLRAGAYDIKKLGFAELAELMQLVAEHRPEDLSTF